VEGLEEYRVPARQFYFCLQGASYTATGQAAYESRGSDGMLNILGTGVKADAELATARLVGEAGRRQEGCGLGGSGGGEQLSGFKQSGRNCRVKDLRVILSLNHHHRQQSK
jgi:hypothetical protein